MLRSKPPQTLAQYNYFCNQSREADLSRKKLRQLATLAGMKRQQMSGKNTDESGLRLNKKAAWFSMQPVKSGITKMLNARTFFTAHHDDYAGYK
jgi:hypothetical protein